MVGNTRGLRDQLGQSEGEASVDELARGVFFDDIEAVSDQFILGKLKSPNNNIGLFGWVVLSWFKFS